MESNYSVILMKGVNAFSEKGFWFKNKNIKIGYSYAEVMFINGDDYFVVTSEDEDVVKTGCYDNWDEFFEKNKLVEFVITQDCAESDNFVTWEKFKYSIDTGEKIHILTL